MRNVPRRRMNKIQSIKNDMDRRGFVILTAVISVILVVLAIISVNYASKNQEKRLDSANNSSSGISSSKPDDGSSNEVDIAFNPRIQEHEPVDLNYFNDAYFIGDSLSVGLGNYGIIPKSNVLADIGLNIETIETKQAISTSAEGSLTVLEALKLKNPKKIYIMLGSNGIAWIDPEKLIQKYTSFINKLKEEFPISTIYISTIPYVTNRKQQEDPRFGNAKIKIYNELLYKMADENKIYFLDVASSIVDDFGNLPETMAESDGMHLKKQGYEKIFNYYSRHTLK